MSARIPTVNDLRVKLCYICREEENAETPQEGPPRAWTHPCSCTLIAHEQCLLKWIQTSQGNASRAPNALRCPQCGTEYEMESDEPIILRGLALGNKVLQRIGRYFTVFGAAAAVGVVGTSIYVCLTGYGVWAVQQFIGKELFDLLLTDDPVNWPWSAYINLPLLPISLILSRFQSTNSSAVIPLLLAWPPSFPVGDNRKRLLDYWSKPENSSRLTLGPLFMTQYWPPPPVFFGLVGLPIIRAIYGKCYAHVYSRLLGTPLPAPRPVPRGGLRFNDGPFVIRIRANLGGEADGDGGADEQEGGDIINQAPDANPNLPGQGQEMQVADAEGGGAVADQDPNAAAVEAAEQLIEINASSLGRRIGGALIIPAIANSMGSLLLHLSQHSSLLRALLGIRPRVSGGFGFGGNGNGNGGFYRYGVGGGVPVNRKWAELNFLQQSKVGIQLIMNAFLSGTRSWEDMDPVWWRNGVGFGLFVVVKDCIQLLHLWLAKRELESRRVKDRDFKGVDIRELDLLPSFLRSS